MTLAKGAGIASCFFCIECRLHVAEFVCAYACALGAEGQLLVCLFCSSIILLLGAFYKSDQFINCAAQIINS